MSVIMMLRVKADAKRLQEVVNGDEARWQAVNNRAKELGAIHHRFLGNADGTEIIVLDEWASPEAFQRFFESSPEIPAIMAEVGVTSGPSSRSGRSSTPRHAGSPFSYARATARRVASPKTSVWRSTSAAVVAGDMSAMLWNGVIRTPRFRA